MNPALIDEAMEQYVNERLVKGREQASKRFLAYAYLKHGNDEIREFMSKVRGISCYYIDFLLLLRNPFKGPEFAWLASMVMMAIYAIYLISVDDERLLGFGLLAGALVFASSLVRAVIRNWCQLDVTIAIYRELAQLAEHELESPV
ncbi:MAG TPA: hypothetical protein VIU41_08955 [Geobacteraceae bacterium]